MIFCCGFWGPFGNFFGMVFGVPGDPGNQANTLKGLSESHLGLPFLGNIFKVYLVNDLLHTFSVFVAFWHPC